jgi:hypothetical protein
VIINNLFLNLVGSLIGLKLNIILPLGNFEVNDSSSSKDKADKISLSLNIKLYKCIRSSGLLISKNFTLEIVLKTPAFNKSLGNMRRYCA